MNGWLLLILLMSMFAYFLSWLVFARLSMARIERAILADGHPRPCPWDGPGVRTLWYARAIAFPVGRRNPVDDRLIDVPLVRRYATRADRIRSWFLMVSGFVCTVVTLGTWFLLDSN